MQSILALGIAALVSVVALESSADACSLAVNDPTALFRLTAPSNRPITTTYGIRKHPVLGIDLKHSGIDFDGPIGDTVKAAAAGQLVEAKWTGESGNRVEIDHGGGYATSYSHLVRFPSDVKPGDCVEPGIVIGFIGATGLTTGPHLHFEVTRHGVWLDPLGFLP